MKRGMAVYAIAIYGFRTALGGKSAFGGTLLDDSPGDAANAR